jgi:hypothetical protein
MHLSKVHLPKYTWWSNKASTLKQTNKNFLNYSKQLQEEEEKLLRKCPLPQPSQDPLEKLENLLTNIFP